MTSKRLSKARLQPSGKMTGEASSKEKKNEAQQLSSKTRRRSCASRFNQHVSLFALPLSFWRIAATISTQRNVLLRKSTVRCQASFAAASS